MDAIAGPVGWRGDHLALHELDEQVIAVAAGSSQDDVVEFTIDSGNLRRRSWQL